MEEFLPYIGIALVVGASLLLAWVAAKISRKGGCTTAFLWIAMTGAGAFLGLYVAKGARLLANAAGTPLGNIEDLLLVYSGALCGLLLKSIISGLLGKGFGTKI